MTAVAFFFEHAGLSYDPATETPDQGRRRSAQAYADAESWAGEIGATFEWSDDWSIDHEAEFDCYDNGGPETCESLVMLSASGEILASLYCVDDATDDYRRVVEAELAWEAMPDESHLVRGES